MAKEKTRRGCARGPVEGIAARWDAIERVEWPHAPDPCREVRARDETILVLA